MMERSMTDHSFLEPPGSQLLALETVASASQETDFSI